MSTDLNALWDAINRRDHKAVANQMFPQRTVSSAIPGAAATGRHSQDETGQEGSSPCADARTASVGDLYPVTCEERYYDAASSILEDTPEGEPNLFTHENCNELGALIQQWIQDARENWEPR